MSNCHPCLRLCRIASVFVTLAMFTPVRAQPRVPANPGLAYSAFRPGKHDRVISREAYYDKLYGFWLGQCIANWTGLVTEMDKIGNMVKPEK